MRFRRWFLLLASVPFCYGWDSPPHRRMTHAAVETLPQRFRDRLGAESGNLAEIYSILPDRYVELKQFGFTRKSAGPRTLEEMQPYCMRPDGALVHSASFEVEEDLPSLVYLFERTIRSLGEKQPGEAARYMGVLAHFIEDSLSPPHAVGAAELDSLAPPGPGRPNLHAILERSVPEFSLGGRRPRAASAHIVPAAEAILSRCYSAAERNRRALPAMVKAVLSGDERSLETYRLSAAQAASGILADALHTIFTISE